MCTKKELKFSLFVIYQLAERWNKTLPDVYKILNDTRILDDSIFVSGKKDRFASGDGNLLS